MKIEKVYEKIEKYADENCYEIKKCENVDGGSVFTVDGVVMYYLPDRAAWTVHVNQLPTLSKLYDGIFKYNYRLGKVIPGKYQNKNMLKISNGPDGGNTYIYSKYTKLFPKNSLYYTIPEYGQASPVVVGMFTGVLHVFGVIMPVKLPNENYFERLEK